MKKYEPIKLSRISFPSSGISHDLVWKFAETGAKGVTCKIDVDKKMVDIIIFASNPLSVSQYLDVARN